jgi:hypothetical protein
VKIIDRAYRPLPLFLQPEISKQPTPARVFCIFLGRFLRARSFHTASPLRRPTLHVNAILFELAPLRKYSQITLFKLCVF